MVVRVNKKYEKQNIYGIDIRAAQFTHHFYDSWEANFGNSYVKIIRMN